MVVLCSDKTGTLTTAKMTVYNQSAAVFNGYSQEQVLTMAALASNPANKDDAIDSAVFQAYAKTKPGRPDVDSALAALGREIRATHGALPHRAPCTRCTADLVHATI